MNHGQRNRLLNLYAAWILLILSPFFAIPPAYPRQQGIVEGKIINRTDPSIIPRGVEVDAIVLGEGMSIIGTTMTDAKGRFRFEGLPESQRMMIRANYQSANYHAAASFNAEGKAYVEIEVFESTLSMKDIRVEHVRMAFQMEGDRLRSLEIISLNNQTHPPRTYMNPEGNFRFCKPPGIIETPLIRITAPGSSMPLVQAALESPDGQSYYSLYPIKPGVTTFEVQQILPYHNRNYTYLKKFYYDIETIDIGISPADMVLSGNGLSLVRADYSDNISIYAHRPVKAGTELTWTFSGGTGRLASQTSDSGVPEIKAVPGAVGRNALIIASSVLLIFLIGLWYALNRSQAAGQKASVAPNQQLRELRDRLLDRIAELDYEYENQGLEDDEYLRNRAESKRRLKKVLLLMKNREP